MEITSGSFQSAPESTDSGISVPKGLYTGLLSKRRASRAESTIQRLSKWSSSTLHKFLRTLEERPDISRNVKILALGSWDIALWKSRHRWTLFGGPIRVASPEERMKKQYDAILLRIQQFVKRKLRVADLVDTFSEGIESAAVGLLLHWTPNIEELHLPVLVEDTQLILPQYERSQLPPSGSLFARLKKIVIRGSEDRTQVMSFKALHRLLQIPTLETFEVHNCRISTFPPVGLNLSSAYSIRRLCIQNSDLQPRALGIIFNKIHRLEHFEYSYIPGKRDVLRARMRLSQRDLRVHHLFEALETHQSTLQTLTIKGPFERGAPPLAIPHFTKYFIALRCLDMEEHCLLGQEGYSLLQSSKLSQRLPLSLVHLTISSCPLQILYHIKDLVLEAHEYLPNLKRISLEAEGWSLVRLMLGDCEWTRTVDTVEGLCELAGIEFKPSDGR